MAERDPGVLDLHRRLLWRDPVATMELVERYFHALVRATRRALRPEDDEQFADDAATDALLDLAERPEQYDPDRMELVRFLRMAARGNMKNLKARRRRRLQHQTELFAVELQASAGNTWQEGSEIEGAASQLEHEALHVASTPEERNALQLMLDGERSTDAYALVLGISHLTTAEQRREVKRVKDRLKKRLDRSSWGRQDD